MKVAATDVIGHYGKLFVDICNCFVDVGIRVKNVGIGRVAEQVNIVVDRFGEFAHVEIEQLGEKDPALGNAHSKDTCL